MSDVRKYLDIINESSVNEGGIKNEMQAAEDYAVKQQSQGTPKNAIIKNIHEMYGTEMAHYIANTIFGYEMPNMPANHTYDKPLQDESTEDSNWGHMFNETVARMKKLAGINIAEDSIYPNADHMTSDRHPNDEGGDGSTPDQKFGTDEQYNDEGPTAPHHRTSHPGRYCELKAPMTEATHIKDEELDEEDIDENSFSYKMAQAAKAGKSEIEIDGKKFKVTMSKDKS
ncbi:MAG: hypothetical protein HC836_23115 [Richelia sp. RM2_1_2]|nr:hypothetical protein [Richelia sp. RM2_1_2]